MYVVALLVISAIIVALFTTMNNPTFASQQGPEYGATGPGGGGSRSVPEFSSGLQISLLMVALLTGMFLVMKVYYKRIGKQAP